MRAVAGKVVQVLADDVRHEGGGWVATRPCRLGHGSRVWRTPVTPTLLRCVARSTSRQCCCTVALFVPVSVRNGKGAPATPFANSTESHRTPTRRVWFRICTQYPTPS